MPGQFPCVGEYQAFLQKHCSHALEQFHIFRVKFIKGGTVPGQGQQVNGGHPVLFKAPRHCLFQIFEYPLVHLLVFQEILYALLGKVCLYNDFPGRLPLHIKLEHRVHLLTAARKQHLAQQAFFQVICLHMLPHPLNQNLIHLGSGPVKMFAEIIHYDTVIGPGLEHPVRHIKQQVILVKQPHQYGPGAKLHQSVRIDVLASVLPYHVICFPHIILADQCLADLLSLLYPKTLFIQLDQIGTVKSSCPGFFF